MTLEYDALPPGWIATSLAELGVLTCGQSPPAATVNKAGIGVPYVTGPEQWDGRSIHLNKWTTDARKFAQDGSIFITVKGAGVGTLFPGTSCAIGRDIYAFHPVPDVCRSFVQYAIKHSIQTLIDQAVGDIPGLSKEHIFGHEIALPPYQEQRRIADKLGALLASVDATRDRLNRIPAILKRLRQAVLAAASSGELTKDWREENGVSDVWPETTVGSVAKQVFDGPFGSNLKSNDYSDAGVRVVRLENLAPMRFIEEKCTYIPEAKYQTLTKHTLMADDILFSSFVDEETRVCLVPAFLSGKAINKADCFCIRVDTSTCNPRFLMMRLACHSTYKALDDAVHGATRPRINLGQLKGILISLPALDEQREIVQRVDQLLTLADVCEQQLKNAGKRLESIIPSILAKAFRGELVPQDLNDEPASVLLERIRKEQSAQAAQPKRRERASREVVAK